MKNMKENLPLDELKKVSGGLVVKDATEDRFWIVRQDGSVIAPAPDMESAIEFAKAFNTSGDVITAEQYKERFGRDLVW